MKQQHKPAMFPLVRRFLQEPRLARERRLNRQAGSTLVEFALVFILFMTMLLGIAGFGHALYAYHFVSESAREATRWAIVNGSTCASDASCSAPATPTDIDTYVKSLAPPGITASNITTTVCGVAGGGE